MSNKKDKTLNRRQALKFATAGIVGTHVGMKVLSLGGSLIPPVGPLDKLRKILLSGDPKALAALTTSAKYPVIQICLIDKIQQALLLDTTGSENPGGGNLNGFDGISLTNAARETYDGMDIAQQTNRANAINFRGQMMLTELFGKRLVGDSGLGLPGLASDYNLAILPQFNSNAGGHSLMASDIDREMGGLNYVIEKEGEDTGMLGAVGFSLRADANNSRDSFVSPGRIPMQTYDAVSQVRSTLKNSTAALNSADRFLDFRKSLDVRANPSDETLETLQGVKDLVDPVMAPLQEAMAASDMVKQQLKTVIALAKSGLASNFMIAVPWDDTNGGGDLTRAGNSGISPYTGVAMLADLYVTISRELPNAVTVVVTDGGRGTNNNDAAGGMTIISGPAEVVNHGMFGKPADLGNLGDAGGIGQAGVDIAMSNGATQRVLEHRHVLSLVAKITHGIDTGIEYPVSVSGVKISNKA